MRASPVLQGALIIACSAYTDPDHRERAQEAGFDYQLPKGTDPERLIAAIVDLLHARQRECGPVIIQ